MAHNGSRATAEAAGAQEVELLVHYLQGQEFPTSSTGPDVSLGKTLNGKCVCSLLIQ